MPAHTENDNVQPIRGFEFLSPVAELVLGFGDIADRITDEQTGLSCYVTDLKIETPVELGVHVDDDGNVQLASAPPTQQIETTIFPTLHRMRLNLAVEDGATKE